MDATVAFDDLLVERFFRSPCVLCQHADPGYYVLWRELETGFVAMFPMCQVCQRRPDKPLQLAYAMQHRLHPEEPLDNPPSATAWSGLPPRTPPRR